MSEIIRGDRMPRRCKYRRICTKPDCGSFGPKDSSASKHGPITMTLDEFESIRLIDFESMTQEECAAQMGVSRTTIQSIYHNARRKIAGCLVQGRDLYISGGDYIMCDGHTKSCRHSSHCTLHNQNHYTGGHE